MILCTGEIGLNKLYVQMRRQCIRFKLTLRDEISGNEAG